MFWVRMQFRIHSTEAFHVSKIEILKSVSPLKHIQFMLFEWNTVVECWLLQPALYFEFLTSYPNQIFQVLRWYRKFSQILLFNFDARCRLHQFILACFAIIFLRFSWVLLWFLFETLFFILCLKLSLSLLLFIGHLNIRDNYL